MVLPALSGVLSAFGVEVLALSLAEAEGGAKKAPGLASGGPCTLKSDLASFSEVGALGLTRTPKTSPFLAIQGKESGVGRVGWGERGQECLRGAGLLCPAPGTCRGPGAVPHLQYLQELPEEPDPLRLQGDLLKG